MLIDAAKEGNACRVEGLLLKGADVTIIDEKKHTNALAEAASAGHLDVVKVLVLKGNTKLVLKLFDKNGYGALAWAAIRGNIAMAEFLLAHGSKESINHPCVHGHSPLMLAADYNQGAMVEYLVGMGAKINQYTHGGASALLHASGKGYTSIVRTLVENGAKVNVHTRKKKHTAVLVAAQGGYADTVALLLEHGADVHYADGDHKNALTYACEGNHQAAAEALCQHGGSLQLYLDQYPKARNVCTAQAFVDAHLKHFGDEM